VCAGVFFVGENARVNMMRVIMLFTFAGVVRGMQHISFKEIEKGSYKEETLDLKELNGGNLTPYWQGQLDSIKDMVLRKFPPQGRFNLPHSGIIFHNDGITLAAADFTYPYELDGKSVVALRSTTNEKNNAAVALYAMVLWILKNPVQDGANPQVVLAGIYFERQKQEYEAMVKSLNLQLGQTLQEWRATLAARTEEQ